MSKYIAIHQLVLSDNTVVLPGQAFTPAKEDGIKRLLELQAAREATDEDSSATVVTRGALADESGSEDGVDLDGMTKAELVAHAKAANIEVDESAKKEVILATIKAAQADGLI